MLVFLSREAMPFGYATLGGMLRLKLKRWIVSIASAKSKDSLEERMVQLQETKSALDKGSMQKLTKEERKKTRITTLKDLFQVEKDLDQKWEGWYKDEEEDNNAKTSRDSLSMATILSRFLDSSLATWGD
jgi:hypothetical protein